MNQHRLYTPGPTPVPDRVLKKMSEQILYHRGQEFREIFARVNENLKYLFRTGQPVLTLACSGTGGMEATFVNLFLPGDKIISVNGGKFGERWVAMPRTLGLNVAEIKLKWGEAPSKEQIVSALKENPEVKAVYLTHCETSTGTATDVKRLAKVIRENSDALICVDGISAVGGIEFHFDEWGVDACVTASQKGLMTPPGLAFIALSSRAIERLQSSALPRYYFDLTKALTAFMKNDSPWTPAISLVTALDEALIMIREEGIENVWERHSRLAGAVRSGIKDLGLKILSDHPSDTVTAVLLPSGIEWARFSDILTNKYRCVVGKGQGEYIGKLFRIGHIGYYHDAGIKTLMSCLEKTLIECGIRL